MIHVPRPAAPNITVFSTCTVTARDKVTRITRAARELQQCIDFFCNQQHYRNDLKVTDKDFVFRVYRDRDLAQELEKVFRGKCAYCESRYGAVAPKNIEHFRPKAEIATLDGATKAPGYYWLAGEWQNLLISCPKCNCRYRHTIPGQPDGITLGKGTQFPLKNEAVRVRSHTVALAVEEPERLLLDPCNPGDEPEQQLSFDEQGHVHPRLDAQGRRSERAFNTISICALPRKELVEERFKVLTDVVSTFEQLAFLVRNQNALVAAGAPLPHVDDNLKQIRKLVRRLTVAFEPSAPYLAMLRDFVRRQMARGAFEDLRPFGVDPAALLHLKGVA